MRIVSVEFIARAGELGFARHAILVACSIPVAEESFQQVPQFFTDAFSLFFPVDRRLEFSPGDERLDILLAHFFFDGQLMDVCPLGVAAQASRIRRTIRTVRTAENDSITRERSLKWQAGGPPFKAAESMNSAFGTRDVWGSAHGNLVGELKHLPRSKRSLRV